MVVLDLLRYLDRSDYDISLIVGYTNPDEPTLLDLIPDDITVIHMGCVVRELSPVKDLTALITLYRHFRKQSYDVLHLHTSKAGVLGSIGGHLAGIKTIIYTPHGHIFHQDSKIPGISHPSSVKMKFLYHLRRYAYSCCDILIALSQADKNEQVKLNLAPAGQFQIIMNGIDIDYFRNANQDSCEPSDISQRLNLKNKVVIGYVGRLSEEKGVDILISAFSRMSETIPNSVLLLVGFGDFREFLEGMVEDKRLGERVIFAGNQDDVRPFLKTMDVLVLPSRYEAQGIAAMEAMASAVPVVASNVGGVPGIIDNEKDGFLVYPESPKELASRIIDVLSNEHVRTEVVQRALERATTQFRVESMIKNYDAVYRKDVK